MISIQRRRLLLGLLAAMPAQVFAQNFFLELRAVDDPTGDGWLNLRTGPGTEFAVVAQPLNGRLFQVHERRGNWIYVRDNADGAPGWLYRPYTSLVLASHIVADPTGDGWLNLRAGPGTNYRVLTRIPNGYHIGILERRNRWIRVGWSSGPSYEAYIGWVYGPYTRPS